MDNATEQFRKAYVPGTIATLKSRYGGLVGSYNLIPTGSEAGERDDMAVQFVQFAGRAKFQKGECAIHLEVALRTTAPRWRIERLQIDPDKS